MKILLKIFISLLVIVIVLAIVFVVLIHLTPRQYHIENMKIGNDTIEELGLADTKIIDIYKSIKNMGKAKESDVVHNGINEEEDKAAAKDNMQGSSLANKDDYTDAVKGHVTYDVQRLVSYDDTTIAYILDNIVQNADESSSDAVKALHDANLSVKELTITLVEGKGHMRVVSYMDLSKYQDDIKEALGSAAGILPIPKYTYLVSDFSFTVAALNGKMETTSEGVCINGNNDDPVSKAILKVIGNMAGGEDIDSLNGKLGQAIAQVVENLGMIGTASTVGDTNVVNPLTINIGIGGVQEHKLTLITHIL